MIRLKTKDWPFGNQKFSTASSPSITLNPTMSVTMFSAKLPIKIFNDTAREDWEDGKLEISKSLKCDPPGQQRKEHPVIECLKVPALKGASGRGCVVAGVGRGHCGRHSSWQADVWVTNRPYLHVNCSWLSQHQQKQQKQQQQPHQQG